MKILLVNPQMPYNMRGHLQTPLGLCYLSSVVKSLAQTMVFDCNINSNLFQIIESFQPNVIAISVLTATYNTSLWLIAEIKRNHKNCLFIAGGVHASTFPEEMLLNGFNLVIRGEGEIPFYNVINCCISNKDYNNVNGISYLSRDNKIIHNKDEILITKLDDLPFPDRNDLQNSSYEHDSIITSRGCNYQCFYCSSSHYWGQHIRYRSAKNVFEELSFLYNNGSRRFYFCDDNFTSSHNLVKEICELIIKNNMEIKWSALIRIDTIDESLLCLMKKAGCAVLSMGIENGTKRFMTEIKKTNLENTQSAFTLIKKVGIKTRTTWIIGLGKSIEDEYESLRFIKQILPDQISIHCLIPFPNTDAWKNAEKYNLVINKSEMDWDIMNMTFSPYLLDYIHFKHISKEQIITLISEIKNEMLSYGYDGKQKSLDTFLDNEIIRVID